MTTRDNTESKRTTDVTTVERLPFYFGPESKRLFGWLHVPTTSSYCSTGVVICQPLASEYMSAYRSMRYVADYFALAGIPALRFDYHGTGDSSGFDEEPDRLKDWLWSIEQAKSQLTEMTGCTRTGLFGFRMGATFAALAAESAGLDFLVLWAALASGRKYMREVRLMQMTGSNEPKNQAPDMLEAGGMVYWPETVKQFGDINLPNLSPNAKRILIVPQDESVTDETLKDKWLAQNCPVEQKILSGSSGMLLDAHQTIVPHQSINRIVDWVQAGLDGNQQGNLSKSSSDAQSQDISVKCIPEYDVTESVQQVKETIFRYGPDNHYFGIFSEPGNAHNEDLPVIIISNSGANHRAGPGRLYVLLSRKLSALGFQCLRLDVPGIGDSILSDKSHENIEYIDKPSEKIGSAIDALGPDYRNRKFVVMGLCSGAYFSFHLALDMERFNLVESILINPLTFYWDEGMAQSGSTTQSFREWNWYSKALISPESWFKLFSGKANYKSLAQAVVGRVKTKTGFSATRKQKQEFNLSKDLLKISERGTYLKLVLARSDPGHDILMTSARKVVKKLMKEEKLDIEFIENADHTFSKYAPREKVITSIVNHIASKYFRAC